MADETLTWNGTALWDEDGSTPRVIALEEQDLGGVLHTFEQTGDPYAEQYRGSRRQRGSYVFTAVLKVDGTYTNVQALKAWWKGLHNGELGLKVLARGTVAGATLYLDCVAEEPEWSDEKHSSIRVTQKYTPPTPYWRSAEQSAAGNFNGTTPVNISCNNAGAIPSWIRAAIAGAVTDPKLAGSGWVIEFDLTLSAGDALALSCKTPASAWYTPSGGSAARAWGYRTEASSARNAKLPTGGASNVVLTAAAGAGAITIYWYNWYEALV